MGAAEREQLRERVAEQAQQLAAKDRQIEQLLRMAKPALDLEGLEQIEERVTNPHLHGYVPACAIFKLIFSTNILRIPSLILNILNIDPR